MRQTTAVAVNAPRNAISGNNQSGTGLNHHAPMTITDTAPKAAPDETPIKPGSANGLRNKPCKTAPDKASALPTNAANNSRGRRSSRTTMAANEPSSCHSACHTSAVLKDTGPTRNASSTNSSKESSSNTNTNAAGVRVTAALFAAVGTARVTN